MSLTTENIHVKTIIHICKHLDLTEDWMKWTWKLKGEQKTQEDIEKKNTLIHKTNYTCETFKPNKPQTSPKF